MARCTILLAVFAVCSGFVVPSAKINAVTVSAATSAVAPARFAVESATMMARGAPKKAAKKPVKKVVKKPVKKVVKKPVKKVVPKKSSGKISYANAQRKAVGGGTNSIGALGLEIAGTLFTPTQLAFIGGWVLLVLKYLIFYGTSD